MRYSITLKRYVPEYATFIVEAPDRQNLIHRIEDIYKAYKGPWIANPDIPPLATTVHRALVASCPHGTPIITLNGKTGEIT
jgi:hypothetical protein